MERSNLMGLMLVFLGTTLFSSKSVLIQYLFTQGINVDQMLFLRMAFSLPFYLVIGWWAFKHHPYALKPKALTSVISAGIACYYLATWLDLWALQYISAGLERIILFSYPLLIAVYSAIRGQVLSRLQWAGVGLAYLGIIAFYWQDVQISQTNLWLPAVAMLTAAAFTAYFTLTSQRYSKAMGGDAFTVVAMCSAAIAVMGHSAVTGSYRGITLTPSIIGWILILTAGSTVLASVLFNRGIAAVGAVKGSLVGMAGPLITILLGNLILGQPTTPLHFVALVLVLLGVAVVNFGKKKEMTPYKTQRVKTS